ncbi:ubxdomain containing protein [Rhodotorula toruloides]|uniref:Ubxdomain containing protein n=1 Tax=Rhodotorula toruloides TaxID=5286 RepID=A0A511KKN3_RHOTO|nr:ubxdomain containing protein [Rhodotorula toruloides]
MSYDPLASLSPAQRDSFETFNAFTARDSATPEQARKSVEMLRDAGWDVQTAIARVYDEPAGSAASTSRHPYPPTNDDVDGVDEALLPGAGRGRSQNGTGGLGTAAVGLYYMRQALAVPISIISVPLALLYNIASAIVLFIARIFRLRPATASFRPRNPFAGAGRPRTTLSPAAAAEQWVQSLERTTGSSRRGGRHDASSASGVQVGSSSGPSRRSTRPPPGSGPRLPAFVIGGYDHALRIARDEMRPLMVVLTSEENERDERFKKEVLTSEEVNQVLEEENMVVWGGDVSDRDAYQVGQTLSYIALPFVAFISLQPSAPPGVSTNPATASTSSPRLRLISRLEPSPSNPLTAASLHAHIMTSVLPRSKPFLSRLKTQKAQREADRRAREEAERRVLENARRDEERVLAVRRREEERKRAELAERERREKEAREKEEKERVAALAKEWRSWKRTELQRRGEAAADQPGAVRVAVRLGSGKRVMRTFAAAEGTVEVYAWVECELEEGEEDAGAAPSPPAGYEQRYHFRLATTFPRQVIPLPSHLTSPSTANLGGVDCSAVTVGEAFAGLGKTVNLVVDGLQERRRVSMGSREDEDSEEELEEDD